MRAANVDGASEGQELPSRAFCKAIDEEQEFDANDVIASGFLDKQKELRPSRKTQVHPAIQFKASLELAMVRGGPAARKAAPCTGSSVVSHCCCTEDHS